MRVLFTTLGSPSHGRAQLPLARALAAAGHDVLVATTPSLVSVFEKDDVRVTTAMDEFTPHTFIPPALLEQAARPGPDGEVPQDVLERVMPLAMSGPMARKLREWILPVAQEFRPDLILRDGMDLGSCLTAEQLGVPQLPTPSGSSNILDPAEVLPGLNALREEAGLPLQEDPLSVVPHGRIDYVPAAFSFAQHLPSSWSYRQPVTVDRRPVLPQWIADLPTDRPLVLAALGTALPMVREMTADGEEEQPPFPMPDPVQTLRSMIAAVSRLEECTVVVSTSGIPADTDGLPPHVHVTDRVPQPLLLESVDLFLTHGGFNSIRESLRTATPMAVLPQFGDQFGNARRVQELGLGREVTDPTPDGITAAVRAVLADPDVGARARAARLAMLALPEIDSAVTDLEKLV
ncbi:glycosyltransferase family 1 protein [Streptomyces roseirectus]|uniref:Glycosyltransferase family 1 protein n=1 Tax=Streptomyces roseirectus TaxID=2768066 RepID=A0A7H0IQE9_9ACTN|nr:glycosyltransferase [Streptomyces roseirectus]QNP75015.1 glycosyltransferase family 1 protein [Streptomyces roseirectus]